MRLRRGYYPELPGLLFEPFFAALLRKTGSHRFARPRLPRRARGLGRVSRLHRRMLGQGPGCQPTLPPGPRQSSAWPFAGHFALGWGTLPSLACAANVRTNTIYRATGIAKFWAVQIHLGSVRFCLDEIGKKTSALDAHREFEVLCDNSRVVNQVLLTVVVDGARCGNVSCSSSGCE